MRYTNTKSHVKIQNKKFTLNLSITSLDNAKSKLEAGIGTNLSTRAEVNYLETTYLLKKK